MYPPFQPALELNRAFYAEVVAPLIGAVPHAAGRLGWGSEILGFDTERSTDHGWGPQLQVFVDADVVEDVQHRIDASLPETFRGWPVRYGWDAVPVRHHVYVSTLEQWLVGRLGCVPPQPLRSVDWLRFPQQRLLGVTAGAVYHDGVGALTATREKLRWFPDDVWLWMLACQWKRIAQEEAFVGRTAQVGDEIGSRLVTARLARELMRLWFLFERTYWPYSKWFGSAFARLPHSEVLADPSARALDAAGYAPREAALVAAYEAVAARHNELGITEFVEPTTRLYYGRPYQVLLADRFVDACIARVTDPALRSLPLIGSVDQFVDSTDVLDYPAVYPTAAAVYDAS